MNPRSTRRAALAATLAAVAMAVGALAGLAVSIPFGSTHEPTVLEGLTAPRGLTPLPDGALLIAEGGSGRILRMGPNGGLSVVIDQLPHLLEVGPDSDSASGVSAAILVDGVYYFVVGEARAKGHSELYRFEPGGAPRGITGQDVLDVFPAKPINNPYDLVAAPNGDLLVSDAGLNAILRINVAGDIAVYVAFPDREVATDAGLVRMDEVPTGLVRGPDGALYMTALTGFPYPAGAANVYRINDANSDGDADDDGETTVFAEGFTAATDLAFDADGSLLVTEFSAAMAELVTDLTPARAAELPGRLVRLRAGGAIEVVADGLVSPTSVAVVDGRIFVSEELSGRVREIGPARSSSIGRAGWALAILRGSVAALIVAGAARVWWLSRNRLVDDDDGALIQTERGP